MATPTLYVNELHFKSCFMHFGDICETVFPITKARLEKFIACRKRWVNLNCEQAEICRNSYECFSDETVLDYVLKGNFELDWPYHKTCYKRLCDEEKIRRAETKASLCCEVENPQTVNININIKRRSTRLAEESPRNRARNDHVLPERCIICQRETPWFKMDKVKPF